MANLPITTSNLSVDWSTEFFAVIFETNEPCDTYYTLDGSDPTSSPTRHLYTTPFIINTDGTTTIKFYSISQITLLSNAVQTGLVKIDSGKPVTTINVSIQPDGDNDWYISLPTVTLSAVDSVSGVDKTYYSWDGQIFQEYLGGIIALPGEGIHYLQVYSIDFASNKEETQTQVIKYDNTAPSTEIIVPLSVVHEPVDITFFVTDNASGKNKTYYTTDGSVPTTQSDSAASFTIRESGLYVIKYFSVDNAGNTESEQQSIPFRVEIETATLQVLLTESFPTNGKNGWYKASPQIGILTNKPNLVTEVKYKVVPKNDPTTAKYTSTVNIVGTIDLSAGAFIALEVDQSGSPLVINIGGVDIINTKISEIIENINNIFGGTIVATETDINGHTGTGYITLTSPTGGTGSPTSEIKFVDPGSYDATKIVFGLDPDILPGYPFTFTETYLYQTYTTLFVLPGDGIWNVAASASTTTETAQLTKDYSIDSTAPVTAISVVPDPNPSGYYTSSPDITFLATDNVSGIDKIIYQFDNGPTLQYHPEDGPIHLPTVPQDFQPEKD
ncbi:MAG: chitobiase/beta-hexosaminidase C-terminal domain-containing protein [Nitrosarchaeum sp.]|nr:chitobiase/beta-hexosaminidase C-terminal domain-containing protein [Nitrosarchaeum sp.]